MKSKTDDFVLVLQGTVREGNKTSIVAEKVYQEIEDHGFRAEYFNPGEHNFPRLRSRREATEHDAVKEFGSLLDKADCLVIATPEYNHSIPGVLKDVLDHYYPEYEGMLFGFVTVSAGGFGGVRAQVHLNEITETLNAINGPKLPVSRVQEHVNENGVDDELASDISDFVVSLREELQ